jgi:hypothetical protein
MSEDDVAIINAAADAAKMARLHGCAIDVHIDRWGRKIHVEVTPAGDLDVNGLEPDVEDGASPAPAPDALP